MSYLDLMVLCPSVGTDHLFHVSCEVTSRRMQGEGVSGDRHMMYLTFWFVDVSMKRGRVVIMLAGRRSGKKAIVVKQIDEGKKNRKFGHALVAGIERAPKKITKRMSQKKIDRKTKIKPFVKFVNYTHLLATRFTVKDDFDFKNIVTEESLETPEARKEAVKALKAKLEERFRNPEGAGERQTMADFIFKRLRF